MVVTGATAVGLLDIAALTRDDVVLVTSAAGGVGRPVVQHARRLGAKVVGAAAGPAKTEAVHELGADLAVDHSRAGCADTVRDALGGDQVTVVVDGVEGGTGWAAFELVGRGGRHGSIGAASGEEFRPDRAESESRGVSFTDALALLPASRTRAL